MDGVTFLFGRRCLLQVEKLASPPISPQLSTSRENPISVSGTPSLRSFPISCQGYPLTPIALGLQGSARSFAQLDRVCATWAAVLSTLIAMAVPFCCACEGA